VSPLVAVPACVKTILEITTTVGAAVDREAVEVVESSTALTTLVPDEEAEAEVKQYMTSKLLVCWALIKVSNGSNAYQENRAGC